MRAGIRAIWPYLLLLATLSFTAGVAAGAARPHAVSAVRRQTAAMPLPPVEETRDTGIENSPLNLRLFRWINGHHTPGWDRFFLAYSVLGSAWVLLPVMLIALLTRWRLLFACIKTARKVSWHRRFDQVAMATHILPLLLAAALQSIIITLLKEAFAQSRPLLMLPNVHWMIPLLYHSFPSADAGIAFTIAVVMQAGARWYGKLLWVLYALLIAYERVYVGVHFPLDVTTGALIGMLCGGVVLALTREARERAVAEMQGDCLNLD
jgi:membrane-associated phospholipid phosphatase